MICPVCCGTEREVTIDCPSDCAYLIASRAYNYERREVDWSKMPFRDEKISPSVLEAHERLFMQLSYHICDYAAANPALVDSDVESVYEALARTYQTLAKGIVYEEPPVYPLRRELYEKLFKEISGYKTEKAGIFAAATSVRDSEIRDALIFFTQIAAERSNGRPKGRAFLDFLRSQFKPGAFSKRASGIVLAP